MSNTIIYFLRHGEVYNPKSILYGRLPRFPLSLEGQKRIKEVARQFKNKDIKHIFSSPMLRARQTAGIMAKELKLEPKISKLINEVKLVFEGMPLQIFKIKFQSNLYSKTNVSRGQESMAAIAHRMFRFLQIIIKKHSGEKILVVSHGDPIIILRTKTLGINFTSRYKKANYLKTGEWFTLTFDKGKYSWK